MQGTRFTTEQRYSLIGEWGLVYTVDGINLIAINPYITTQNNESQQFQAFLFNRGAIALNDGVQFYPSGTTDLAVWRDSGTIEGLGWGGGDVDNPHQKDFSAVVSDITGQNRYSAGVYTSSTALIDPTIYENPIGTPGAAVPLPINVTVYRLTTFQSGLARWQMGQTIYGSINEAMQRTLAGADAYVTEQNISDAGCTTTFLAIQKNCTSWSQTDRYQFFVNPKTGGTSGAFIPTMQATYDVSSSPHIVTSLAKGAIDFQGGTGTNTDKTQQWKNNAGSVTASVDGNGLINSASMTASLPVVTNASKDFISRSIVDFRSDIGVGSGTIVVTSGTNFTTPSTITANTVFYIEGVGGGGGGGSVNATNQSGSGGGGGGYGFVVLTGLAPSTNYACVIGQGGAAANAGTATTLTIGATTYTSNGGGAGGGTTTSAGGAGGTATNWLINITGQSGGDTSSASAATTLGEGGSSPKGWGLGGYPVGVNMVGKPATGYGGGGSGGKGITSAGGAGSNGIIFCVYIN